MLRPQARKAIETKKMITPKLSNLELEHQLLKKSLTQTQQELATDFYIQDNQAVIFGTSQQIINCYLSSITSKRIKLSIIDIDAFSIARALRVKPTEKIQAYIRELHNKTEFTVMENNAIIFSKLMPVDDIEASISSCTNTLKNIDICHIIAKEPSKIIAAIKSNPQIQRHSISAIPSTQIISYGLALRHDNAYY